MTISLPSQARNETYAVISAAWIDPTKGNQPREFIQFVDQPRQRIFPPKDNPPCAWIRVSLEHVTSNRVTLSNEVSNRRYRRFGLVACQVFSPMGDSLQLGDRLAKVVNDSMEGVTTSPGGVYYFDTRINEIGADGEWFQYNVLSDFYYDEIK